LKGSAVVFTNKFRVEFKNVDIPEPQENDVVIEIEHSWISPGTESSYLRAERIGGETPYRDGDPWPFPIVAGYQKTGVIRAVGSAVQGLRTGDHVFAATSRVSNMYSTLGGHVNPAVTPANNVWKLPEFSTSLDYSGLVLTQVGYNCGTRPPVNQGDHAIVIGDGLVGQWTAQILLHRGARVTVLGRHDNRLNYLPEDVHAVNTRQESLKDVLQAWDKSVAVVVDSVGDMETVWAIQQYMQRDSHIVSAGFLGEKGIVDIQKLRSQEITLHTPSGWTKRRMDETLQAIHEGWLRTSPLITHRFRVEQAAEAWSTIIDNKASCLGVILDW
jgi:3-hydroxyethyl bacteriochlorophyllide a dehydrogenase